MSAQINPEVERMRAQSILRSFTDYNEAVELLTPARRQGEQDCDQAETTELAAPAHRSSILRIFRLNRRPAADEAVQQPAYSPRRVTPSGC